MEIAIVMGLMVLVVAVKGLTTVWLGKIKSSVKETQVELGEATRKLENVEAAKLQLERDKQALDREGKLLESEKDLLCMEIQKLGGKPIPEDELDAMDAVSDAAQATGDAAAAAPQPEEAAEAEPAGEEEGAEAPPSGETGEAAVEPSRVRILVVDDNMELRELLRQILSRKYDVDSAVDGYEALTKIVKEKQAFDLLITDLKMPNVDGFRLVKNLPEKIPTIIVSGFLRREEFRAAVSKLDPVAVLEKPFKMADMRKAIERVLEGRGAASS